MGGIKEAIKSSTNFNRGEPLESYTLVYDSPSAHLESVYFWLLDFMQGLSRDGVEKVTGLLQKNEELRVDIAGIKQKLFYQ